MAAHHRNITDTELDVLKALWELGEGSVRDVLGGVPAERQWAYTTVQTLLRRLEEKGCVESEKRGRAFVFRATYSRDELVGRSLDDLASRMSDGKAMPLLLNLVQSPRFSRRDLKRFRKLLDELEEGRS